MKILSMPAGGFTKNIIYDEGSWNYAYENPGSYKTSGLTPGAFTLNANSFSCTANSGGSSANMIGLAVSIDMTPYTTLHVIANGLHAKSSSCGNIAIGPTQEYNDNAVATNVTTVGSDVEYTLNVAGLNANEYIMFRVYDTRGIEVKKVWLT